MKASTRFQRRPYEIAALVAVRAERVITLFWTRRGRKSTTLGSIAFDEMSVAPGRTVISASASLLLGTELVSMTVSATEQAILVANEAEAVQSVFEASAEAEKLDFRCANADTGKIYSGMTREDFADLYKSKRLEMRLYHDRTDYSRQLVIAPNPATARGWRGTVLRDEAGFTGAALENELRMAVDPIFRDVPDLKMIYASNLSRDDRHPFFEMTMPPADVELPVNAQGNFYRGAGGMLVHRVTLQDAYESGHTLYSNKGEPMSYAEFARDPSNKAQMPYNYDLNHIMGGSSAIDLLALLGAQTRGARQCVFAFIDSEAEFQAALAAVLPLLGAGEIGAGFDVATTTNEMSNPSAITITEKVGVERIQRLVICWKEKDPAVASDRVKRSIKAVNNRREGGPVKRLCVDGSNERYYAQSLIAALAEIVPVDVIVNSTSVHPPGYQEKINMKTYLGDIYTAAVNDNRTTMPAGEYFKKDQRQPVKDRGTYQCAVDSDGGHGDTFDSGKLAEWALRAGSAPPALPVAFARRAVARNRRGILA